MNYYVIFVLCTSNVSKTYNEHHDMKQGPGVTCRRSLWQFDIFVQVSLVTQFKEYTRGASSQCSTLSAPKTEVIRGTV